jgi:O-antigen/teichoic acid export membrane protein
MLLVIGVTLYTSRVVLDKLGVVDYGIYNTVAGVVAVLGFLNSTLSTSTSRFLTVELGKSDFNNLKRTFSTAFFVHLILALFVVLILELGGVWFINNKLIIPENRLLTANVVFQFSLFTTFISITQVPYTSAIIAHENMSIYAYVGVVEAVLKLCVALLLAVSPIDKLIFYAALIALSQLIVAMSYRIYCIKHYKESSLTRNVDKSILKSILSFSGLSLIANVSQILLTQGIIVLMNMFFAPAVVAAQAICNQVSGALSQFVNNIRTAIDPQVIKSYSIGDYEGSKKLLLNSSVFIFELLLLLGLPIIVLMKHLLSVWLVNVPEYTVEFARCTVVMLMLNVYNGTLYVSMIASNKIKLNSAFSVYFGIGTFILMYILLKFGLGVMWIQYTLLCNISIWSFIIKPYIVCKEMNYTWSEIYSSYSKCVKVSILPIIVSIFCYNYFDLDNVFFQILVKAFIICTSVLLSAYVFLTREMKSKIRIFVRNRIELLGKSE